MFGSLPITPLRGVVLPGIYNFDGPWMFGLRKKRVKRLFGTPWTWFDKPILKYLRFVIGLNVWRRVRPPSPHGIALSDKYRPSVIAMLADHYELRFWLLDDSLEKRLDQPLVRGNFFDRTFVGETARRHPMLAVMSKIDGGYVGDPETALMLLRRGIQPQRINPKTKTTCSIGFCVREQKWYGWSHRAMFGFGVGSKVGPGNCGYVADTPEGLIENHVRFWADDGNDERAQKALNECEILPDRSGIRIRHEPINIPMALDMAEAVESLERGIDLPEEPIGGGDEIIKCGRGEWVAKTLDDARQMAIDFAESVS